MRKVKKINTKMNFGQVIFIFPCNIRLIIRYLEKLEKMLVKADLDVLFKRTCIFIYMCVCAVGSKRPFYACFTIVNVCFYLSFLSLTFQYIFFLSCH